MSVEEDVRLRLSRFLLVALVMLACGMSALGHIALSLRGRTAQARSHGAR